MTDLVTAPQRFFQDRYGLDTRSLEAALGTALVHRTDYADLYFEFRLRETYALEDGQVKRITQRTDQGAGVRVMAGEKTGYAYSEEVSLENLRLAARTAHAIAPAGGGPSRVVLPAQSRSQHDLYPTDSPPIMARLEEKLELLEEVDKAARRFHPSVRNVLASLLVEHKLVLIVTSTGTVVGDAQPLVRLHATCIAERGQRRERGSAGGGGRWELAALRHLPANGRPWYLHWAESAARQAVINLEATEAPAGTMTVVLGPGWPGILLHEAVGHGLEGDFNRKGVSAFSGRLGSRVATEVCTVVDDGTLERRRGSLNVDDEGTPTRRTVLIERGILRGYLQDRLNARLMGMRPTGNGRRESAAHPPMPRMTNTFMLPGADDPADIIRSVDRGLYAVSFGGGQVDITSGKFVFSASEAYLIENGAVTCPVRGATLIGHGPEVLTRISRVGADLRLDDGIGTCGKDGQAVPVGVGLPTVRIDGLTVGGTQPQ